MKLVFPLLLFLLLSRMVGAQTELKKEVWDGTVAESFAGGTGEALDPYLICTGAQLAKLAVDVSQGNTYDGKFFQLAADIVLNEDVAERVTSDRKSLTPWIPIGSKEKPYKGNFDGQLHVVIGVYAEGVENQGLFGYLDSNGIIQNLGVVDGYVHQGGDFIGICGDKKGTIINCYTTNCHTGKIID